MDTEPKAKETPLQKVVKDFFESSQVSETITVLNRVLYEWVNSEDFNSMNDMPRKNELFQIQQVMNLIPQLHEAFIKECKTS
jgi:hypothetical protein